MSAPLGAQVPTPQPGSALPPDKAREIGRLLQAKPPAPLTRGELESRIRASGRTLRLPLSPGATVRLGPDRLRVGTTELVLRGVMAVSADGAVMFGWTGCIETGAVEIRFLGAPSAVFVLDIGVVINGTLDLVVRAGSREVRTGTVPTEGGHAIVVIDAAAAGPYTATLKSSAESYYSLHTVAVTRIP